jgi:hypothetical protein
MAYNVGLTGPYDYTGVISNPFFAAAALYYADRAPLVTRLTNKPAKGTQITAVDDAVRVTSTAINDANGITNSATALPVDDASFFLPGDVIQIGSELCLVSAANATSNVLTISRGHAGSTAAVANDNTTVYLVSNTRTGAEVDQDALTRTFDTAITYFQTVQHPYQIGGALEAAAANMAIPMGFASLVGYQRAKAMMECLLDFERAAYYGKAVALAADTTRPMMQGLVNRIVTNKVTSPTNASAYKPSDLQRDAFTAPRSAGGKPDVLVVSSEYQNAFAIWGIALLNLKAGDNALGVDVTTFVAPDLGGVRVIFAPQLRAFTAFTLTSEEVYWAWKREPMDKPRGSRGDATEGDVIGEGTIVLNNESHHAWVSGVTAFAKQA